MYIHTTSQKKLLLLSIINHTAHACCPLRARHLPTIEGRRDRAPPCRFHPFIHPSAHAHSYTDRLHWPCDEIESARNLEASERIDRARDGEDARAQCPPRLRSSQSKMKPHSIARSLAHSRLAASAHTIGSSRHHQHCTFLARRADDGRMRDRPNNASPHACPRPASPLPTLPFFGPPFNP